MHEIAGPIFGEMGWCARFGQHMDIIQRFATSGLHQTVQQLVTFAFPSRVTTGKPVK